MPNTTHTPGYQRRSLISERMVPWLFLAPGLLAILTLALYPFLYALSTSLHSYYLANPAGSRWVGLDNFSAFFRDNNFWDNVSTTIRYVVVAVGIEVPLGFAIALLLHTQTRFKLLWRAALIIPVTLAPVVVGALWKFMYNNQFGIITYLTGLVGFESLFLGGPNSALWSIIVPEIWQWTPFVTLICLAGLATLPDEPYEAAAVDGASAWQILRYITLPLMKPFLTIALVLRLITAYKVFDPIYLMTGGGPGISTQVLSIRVYELGFATLQMGRASALALLLFIVATLLTKFVVLRLLESRQDEGDRRL